jgi:hypothetical protein
MQNGNSPLFNLLTATVTTLSLGVVSYGLIGINGAQAQTGATPTPTPGTTPTVAATATPAGPAPSLTTEGISGDVDKKRRGPVVSVGTDYTKGNGSAGSEKARILVDAFIPNGEYQKYPIRFDFYVNRQFFTSQLRSTELPGPVGIEVPSERAKVPFNYSVVATLLHPNREFTTILHGAIFANDLTSKLSKCTFSIAKAVAGGDNSSGSTAYVSSDVTVEQVANNTVRVAFTSSSLSDGSEADDEINVDAALAFSGTTVSGTVRSTVNDSTSSSAVTGTGAIGENGVSELSVATTDKGISLACE